MPVGRVGAAVLLVVAGSLLVAASWQRWAGVCGWGQGDDGACVARQDHRFDVVAPSAPWQPVGDAAQLAGLSVLVLAAALAVLPWALRGRRPGRLTSAAIGVALLAQSAVGAATLASGLGGSVVRPVTGGLAVYLWLLWLPALLVRLAVGARGWGRAACVLLLLASPLVAALTYAVGPYDARPWWEAVSGSFTVLAGACLAVAAVTASGRDGPG